MARKGRRVRYLPGDGYATGPVLLDSCERIVLKVHRGREVYRIGRGLVKDLVHILLRGIVNIARRNSARPSGCFDRTHRTVVIARCVVVNKEERYAAKLQRQEVSPFPSASGGFCCESTPWRPASISMASESSERARLRMGYDDMVGASGPWALRGKLRCGQRGLWGRQPRRAHVDYYSSLDMTRGDIIRKMGHDAHNIPSPQRISAPAAT